MPDVIVYCPNCQQQFSIDSSTLGRQFQCVQCGRSFAAALPAATPIPMQSKVPPAYFGESGTMITPRSRVAIAALICSLLCWIWPVSIAALALGIVGVIQTKNYQKRGSGMAITGIVLGAIGLFADPVAYLMISIILPSLSMARQAANSAKSASDMRQIGVALISYESMNRGAYPPDLETLITNQSLLTNLFVYPGGNDTPAVSAATLTSGGHLSYAYIPMQTRPTDPVDTVVLYEIGPGHLQRHVLGLNLLYADGHVDFKPMATANAEIQASRATAAAPGF